MHIWQHVTESAYREILLYERQITITIDTITLYQAFNREILLVK